MARLHLIVRGRVQGVFFRTSVREVAEQLKLVGWVRNRPDAAVEIVAEGDALSLARLNAWAAHGPAGAAVKSVAEIAEKETGEFRRFTIRN